MTSVRGAMARIAVLGLLGTGAVAAQYRNLSVDASAAKGVIRSFQAVDSGPVSILPGGPDLSARYKELHIDLVRTHDLYGPTEIDSHFEENFFRTLIPDPAKRGAFVREANQSVIFPNADANPESPESYNFKATDRVVSGIRAVGADVYFHVGRSFGATGVDKQPVDEAKYATILKHVVMHYNKGWDHGMRGAVKYWAIWTEPEFPEFWSKPPERLFAFYDSLAHAVKSADPTAKVGGIGKAFAYEPGPYREGFLDYVAKNHAPLDFYTWNWFGSYSGDAYDPVVIAKQIRELLDARGLQRTESHMAEWNISTDNSAPVRPIHESMMNAAFTGAVMSYLQDAAVSKALIYRGDSLPSGLFNSEGAPLKKFYAFKAMGEMLRTPRRLAVTGADTIGFAALAGISNDGKTIQILISNHEIPKELKPLHPKPALKFQRVPIRTVEYKDNRGYKLTVDKLPWGKSGYTVKRYLLDQTHDFTQVEDRAAKGASLELSNELPPPSVELITLQKR
ncbi:MAG: GH39 family glycosyl hydrolase [Bryobacteraceae bacterium]